MFLSDTAIIVENKLKQFLLVYVLQIIFLTC